MTQHWPHTHHGETTTLPHVYQRWINDAKTVRAGARPSQDVGCEVRVQPGAGKYEDQFRFYWLVAAWVLLGFHVLVMAVALSHMMAATTYQWLPPAITTLIIIPAFATTACIYRYILFPATGYYIAPDLQAELAHYYAAEQPAPRSQPQQGVAA